jgi:hypothetical protein
MPSKECHVVDERLRLLARLLEGEKMAPPVRRVRDLAEDWVQDFRPLHSRGARGYLRGAAPWLV